VYRRHRDFRPGQPSFEILLNSTHLRNTQGTLQG
jgi:hypothetical protein